MYAHVSGEEWIWRGLAIATILALVGMAVMPMSVGDAGVALMIYGAEHHDGANFLNGLISAGGALYEGVNIATTLATAEELTLIEAAGIATVGVPILGIMFA